MSNVARVHASPPVAAAVTVKQANKPKQMLKIPYSLLSLPTKNGLKKTLVSPVGALLLLSTFTFLWCGAEIFSPPPFGVNTGWHGGSECDGPDFQPMPVCICPRETVCIKDVKSLIFLAFARASAELYLRPLILYLCLPALHGS